MPASEHGSLPLPGIRARRLLKCVGKWLLGLVIVVVAAALVIAWIAAGQLLHPERKPLQDYQRRWISQPQADGLQVRQGSCVQGRIPCLFVAATSATRSHGILVLLHGRRGRKEDLLPVARRFAAAGFRCVIPDLPSHGDSPLNTMRFATSASEQNLAHDVLQDARRHFGDRREPAALWGISMGGAYAVRAASATPADWKAVVVVSSFDSLEGVVNDYLHFLPRPFSVLLEQSLRAMLWLRGGVALSEIEPSVWATQINAPALVVHGDRDGVIAQRRGRHLFESLHSARKSWFSVAGAAHGNVLIRSDALYLRMTQWFLAYVR